MEPQVDFAGNIQVLETLKTGLADSLAAIYQALLKGDSADYLQASAQMTITCFLLCKRLGLNYGHLDQSIYETLQTSLRECFPAGNPKCEKATTEKPGYYRDIATLRDYFELKR